MTFMKILMSAIEIKNAKYFLYLMISLLYVIYMIGWQQKSSTNRRKSLSDAEKLVFFLLLSRNLILLYQKILD